MALEMAVGGDVGTEGQTWILSEEQQALLTDEPSLQLPQNVFKQHQVSGLHCLSSAQSLSFTWFSESSLKSLLGSLHFRRPAHWLSSLVAQVHLCHREAKDLQETTHMVSICP